MKQQTKIVLVKDIANLKSKSISYINVTFLCLLIGFLNIFYCKTLAKRIVCLVMLACGIPIAHITESTGLCERSVRQLKKNIETGNTKDIFVVKGGGRKGSLADIEQKIIEIINVRNFHSRQQIVDMIENEFGVNTSVDAVGRLLKKNKIKLFKSGSLPAKADPVVQRTFYEEHLAPLLKKASLGSIKLLFMDASHFVLGGDFLGRIYGSKRRYVKTFSGRKRYNVLGAIDFMTKKLTTVTNNTYITTNEVCDLLWKIALESGGKQVYLVLDNARYQKNKAVLAFAAELGITLVYIPPYSPNLNLIERFWKHVKSRLRTKHYEDFSDFCETINSILRYVDNKDKKAVDSLISAKIQLFDNLEQINESTFIRSMVEKKAA